MKRDGSPAMQGPQRIAAVIAAALAVFLIARANFGDVPERPTAQPVQQAISPTEVVASSEVAGFHADHLIDGNPESAWSGRWSDTGEVELRFRFAAEVVIDALEIDNLPDRFGRISWYELHSSDDFLLSGELDDVPTSQRVNIPPTATQELVVHITDVYPPATAVEAASRSLVALAEMRFFGPTEP